MLTLIEKLRTKSKIARIHYALIVALLLTSVVTLLWSLTLPARLTVISSSLSGEELSTTDSNTNRSVWSKLQASVGDWWQHETGTPGSTNAATSSYVASTTQAVLSKETVAATSGKPIRIATSSAQRASTTVIQPESTE